MKTITLVGIDLAKEVFEIHGVDSVGRTRVKKTVKRRELASFTAQLAPCRIVMESCGGAHYWARLFSLQGHQAQLIAAQNVKPFKKSRQKNDQIDAEAIVEAGSRPRMRYVAVKTLHQQDIQSLHRNRQQLITMRTQVSNQIRGLLMEYGVVISKGVERMKIEFAEIIENAESELTPVVRQLVSTSYELFKDLMKRQVDIEKILKELMKENEDYQRLTGIPGVGPHGASMFIASVGDPNVFKNGRHLAAWIGLVPCQHSSGGKEQLGRITKAGDQHLRAMLIHGARSLLLATIKKQGKDPRSEWILRLHREKGWNKTAVAIANRNVRVMWHLFKYKEEYKAA